MIESERLIKYKSKNLEGMGKEGTQEFISYSSAELAYLEVTVALFIIYRFG